MGDIAKVTVKASYDKGSAKQIAADLKKDLQSVEQDAKVDLKLNGQDVTERLNNIGELLSGKLKGINVFDQIDDIFSSKNADELLAKLDAVALRLGKISELDKPTLKSLSNLKPDQLNKSLEQFGDYEHKKEKELAKQQSASKKALTEIAVPLTETQILAKATKLKEFQGKNAKDISINAGKSMGFSDAQLNNTNARLAAGQYAKTSTLMRDLFKNRPQIESITNTKTAEEALKYAQSMKDVMSFANKNKNDLLKTYKIDPAKILNPDIISNEMQKIVNDYFSQIFNAYVQHASSNETKQVQVAERKFYEQISKSEDRNIKDAINRQYGEKIRKYAVDEEAALQKAKELLDIENQSADGLNKAQIIDLIGNIARVQALNPDAELNQELSTLYAKYVNQAGDTANRVAAMTATEKMFRADPSALVAKTGTPQDNSAKESLDAVADSAKKANDNVDNLNDSLDKTGTSANQTKSDEKFKDVAKYAVDFETAFNKVKELQKKSKLTNSEQKDAVGYAQRMYSLRPDDKAMDSDFDNWFFKYEDKFEHISDLVNQMTEAGYVPVTENTAPETKHETKTEVTNQGSNNTTEEKKDSVDSSKVSEELQSSLIPFTEALSSTAQDIKNLGEASVESSNGLTNFKASLEAISENLDTQKRESGKNDDDNKSPDQDTSKSDNPKKNPKINPDERTDTISSKRDELLESLHSKKSATDYYDRDGNLIKSIVQDEFEQEKEKFVSTYTTKYDAKKKEAYTEKTVKSTPVTENEKKTVSKESIVPAEIIDQNVINDRVKALEAEISQFGDSIVGVKRVFDEQGNLLQALVSTKNTVGNETTRTNHKLTYDTESGSVVNQIVDSKKIVKAPKLKDDNTDNTNKLVKAYKTLINTQKEQIALQAKVDNETATDAQVERLNSINQARKEALDLLDRQKEKQTVLNEEEAKAQNQWNESKSQETSLKEKANEREQTIKQSISDADTRFAAAYRPDIDGFDSIYKRAEERIKSLKEKLQTDKIDNVQTGFIDKVTKEIGKLDNVLEVVPVEEFGSVEEKLKQYASTLSGVGEAQIKMAKDNSEAIAQFVDDFNRLKEIKVSFDKTTGAISKSMVKDVPVPDKWETFFGKLKGRMGELVRYFSTFVGVQELWGAFKQGIGIIHELDDALTEMNKVSNESLSTLQAYGKESFKIADSIGTSGLQIQKSTADWMRLGESLNEAKESAKASNVLLNVSEFDNIDSATESLVAMSSAYSDLGKMDIIDKLNNIGNNYAISTDGIATALQRSASALKTAGNDIDEATALITAGNTIVQNPESVGAGLRTIALRIQGSEVAKKELQEMGEDVDDYIVQTSSKLNQSVQDLTAVASNNFEGISILDDNGNFKSTYQILQSIADVWKEIAETDKQFGNNAQQTLLELLAGKNRSNILASVLESPDLLRSVYQDSQNSEGSALEENQKYMDSISGHMEKLKNKWQELWAGTAGRDQINFFIDLGGVIVDIIDKVGLLITAFGAFAAFKGIKAFLTNFDKSNDFVLYGCESIAA